MSQDKPISVSTEPSQSQTPPPEPADPQADLNFLKSEKQDYKDQIDTATQLAAGVDQDIAVLTAGLTEIDQIVKAYSQAIQAAGDPAVLKAFIDQEYAMAVAAVGQNQSTLDKVITGYDSDIKTQQDLINNEKTPAADDAAQALADAKAAAAVAQTSYNNAKAAPANFTATNTDLKTLKTQVTTAADQGNYGIMYFLVKEMQVDESITYPSADDLRATLNTALAALKKAKADVRAAQQTSDTAAADLAAANKTLSDLVAGRRAAIQAQIKALPQQAQATKQPATSRG